MNNYCVGWAWEYRRDSDWKYAPRASESPPVQIDSDVLYDKLLELQRAVDTLSNNVNVLYDMVVEVYKR